MTNDTILRGELLSKLYLQGEKTIYALRDVSLSVRRGEFVMICGKSGSGKSTLLNMLSGFDTPTSGKVFIDGIDIHDAPEKENAASGTKRSVLYSRASTCSRFSQRRKTSSPPCLSAGANGTRPISMRSQPSSESQNG